MYDCLLTKVTPATELNRELRAVELDMNGVTTIAASTGTGVGVGVGVGDGVGVGVGTGFKSILPRILKPAFWVTDGKPVLIPITFDDVRANSNK